MRNNMTNPARIVIAGTASGVGKTTISTGLMAALAARGLRVQAYKVGPDYIDPTYHRTATGRPSYNLDTWLSSQEMVRRRFDVGMRDADVAVIEGVMGLFDGRKGTLDSASTAEIARLFDAPVLLVLDVSHMGQSAAALVAGFQHLDPRVRVAGVILNRVASADHEATVRYALANRTEIPVFGAIRRDPSLTVPTRHLGLVPAPEAAVEIQELGNSLARMVDIDGILHLARSAGSLPVVPEMAAQDNLSLNAGQATPPVRVGIATDAAFSFYYPETFEEFVNLGATVIPFSPLRDRNLPDEIDLLYFGGGFPELFADQLAENQTMLADVRSAAQRGVPIYAECGGYMYLGKYCIDAANTCHAMLGLLPYTFRMGKERTQIGYREVITTRETIIGPGGTRLRGHEFHWSQLTTPLVREHAAYELEGRENAHEGYADATILASYIHVPLAANPHVMKRLLHNCLFHREARNAREKVG